MCKYNLYIFFWIYIVNNNEKISFILQARNRAESPSITRINQRTSNNSTNNTWSGARTKTKQRSTITPETFERNSPTRKSTSLNGSPTKTNSKIRTPLAKQLLHTAQTATNEDELLAQMKQLLLNYDRNGINEYLLNAH